MSLVLLYLSDNESEFLGFNRPGAIHIAPWMSKMIFSIKLDLLSKKIIDELPKGSVFGSGKQEKVKRFVQFFIFCYVPWWLTAPVLAAAPSNDILLINSLIHYRKIDKLCADAAMKAFSRHMWYLTEELVPLGLFCGNVSVEVKEKMVKRLRSLDQMVCSKRFGSGFGKPVFSKIPEDTVGDSDLSLFIGEDSWSFFKVMRMDYGFLDKTV